MENILEHLNERDAFLGIYNLFKFGTKVKVWTNFIIERIKKNCQTATSFSSFQKTQAKTIHSQT